MSHPTDTSDAAFENDVLKSELPVVVDFGAPWCGPCRMLDPILEELAQEYEGRLKFFRMNVDDNKKIPAKYGVSSIPTLIFFKNGEKVSDSVGFNPKDDLVRWFDKELA